MHLQPSIFVPGDLPGDYNDDGIVNAADFTAWRDRLGSSTILPNDTTPGTVTPADYTVWIQFFGTTVPPAGLATTDFSVDSEPPSGEVASRADTPAWTQPQIQSRVTVAALVGHSRLSTGNATVHLDRARMLRDTLLLVEPGRVDRPDPQDFGIASVAATAPGESAQDDGRWLSALELAFAELRPGDVTAWTSLN